MNLHAKLVAESGFVGDGSDRYALCLACADHPGFAREDTDQPCPRCDGTGFVGPRVPAHTQEQRPS